MTRVPGFFLKDMRFLELWRPMHGTTTRRLPSIEKFLSCQLVITLICNITRAHILRLPRHQAETNEVIIIIIFRYERNKSRISRPWLHFTPLFSLTRFDSWLMPAPSVAIWILVLHQLSKLRNSQKVLLPRLRELVPAARSSEDAESRNLNQDQPV